MDDGPLPAFCFRLRLYHPSYPEGVSTRPIMAVLRARRRSRTSLKNGFTLIASGDIFSCEITTLLLTATKHSARASQNRAFGNTLLISLTLISLTSIGLALANARYSLSPLVHHRLPNLELLNFACHRHGKFIHDLDDFRYFEMSDFGGAEG